MKMKLTFDDRVALMYSILPQHGSLAAMRTTRTIRTKVKFTPSEEKLAGLREVNKRLVYSQQVCEIAAIEIEFKEVEIDLIRTNIERLDQHGQVQEQLLDTIEKFEV